MSEIRKGNRYAISDIHGCHLTFRKLIEKVGISKNDELYLLGDYIDRGPDSKGVIDFILELLDSGYKVRMLKGNHEDMLLAGMYKQNYFKNWLGNGGREALKSFKTDHPSKLDEIYINFFNSLEYYIELEDFYLVHAGFNFRISNPLEDKQAMLWIRNFDLDENFLGKRKLIHGHSPKRKKEILETLASNGADINIDSGCIYTSRNGMGRLSCLNLDSMEITFTKNKDN